MAKDKVIVEGLETSQVEFGNLETVLAEPDTQLRLFGKPKVKTQRRMGVVLALGETIEQARNKATKGSNTITVQL